MKRVVEPHPVGIEPLRPADRDLYVRLYTDPGVMTHIGPPWTPAAAAADFRAALALPVRPLGESRQRRIIRIDGIGAGLLSVDRQAEVIDLGLMLLPDWQGRGIGTRVFRQVLAALVTPGRATLQVQYRTSNRAMAALARAFALESPSPGSTRDRIVQRLCADAVPESLWRS